MKSNSGITMTGLIIYIVAIVIVITIVANITSFFYSNIINTDDNSKNISEISKFNMYFLEEVKSENNDVLNIDPNGKYISFTSGNIYVFQDNCIYKNNVRICENISNIQFSVEEINKNKVIGVLINIGNNMEYSKYTQYVLKSM